MVKDPMLFDRSIWPICIDVFDEVIRLELPWCDLLGACQ